MYDNLGKYNKIKEIILNLYNEMIMKTYNEKYLKAKKRFNLLIGTVQQSQRTKAS